jgi:hypothetical protein
MLILGNNLGGTGRGEAEEEEEKEPEGKKITRRGGGGRSLAADDEWPGSGFKLLVNATVSAAKPSKAVAEKVFRALTGILVYYLHSCIYQ